ncbi:endo alpha-1,4 polygalactosaminidase [Aspergillus clavatus NRRL 1]|uniref:alpha-galactosidase n=1 Tax=Aspergillus clavatus (strain ATCC 1007 / CBS 513.65 / DSM 816 / NCTC 3887 / NRRL 1 / QM 1276 / 107) TaxID=344612 RepID=A1CJQ4_ASPCL|nr:endo alpha-1,4 polygalactosaminidase, putative [Aspergillus clavatus NRRL 1]EAW09378.1 endo alpha-1,4 polygalactosaminidase, putative [Aspergillus clavatus NRRL 1]
MTQSFDKGQSASGWKSWSTKKKIFVLALVLLVVVALAVGLGVGLGVGLNHGGGDNEGSGSGGGGGGGNTTTTPPESNSTTAKWQPAVGTTWQIELLYPLNDTSVNVDVYDIDLFNNDKSTIKALQDAGRKVICYFSAGSYENWRPDKGRFKPADLGKDLDGWEGEKWLNLSSANVRQIMLDRLDMARDKGCDGVDPDNVDGYDNENGLDLTEADSIDFVNFLANAAHARNMSVGLKNAGAIIKSVITNMQWSVNEQCAQYSECDTYAVFPENGKPVFHIEYPKGADTNNGLSVTTKQKDAACQFADSGNFSTVIKNMDLDNWIQMC